MNCDEFIKIMNNHIMKGGKKLLIGIAANPERFVGLFRPTKPKAKLLQSFTQSQEIRFGDAMEEVIRNQLQEIGFKILSSRIQYIEKEEVIDAVEDYVLGIEAEGGNGEVNDLVFDQYFSSDTNYFLVEQKVRDDHDSTKKRGQISNFESKVEVLFKQHKEKLIAIMFFIDPSITKNVKYYRTQLNRISINYGIETRLFYGREMFSYFGYPEKWDEIVNCLEIWRNTLPEFPELNFDTDVDLSFEQLKDIDYKYWRRLILSDSIWETGIMSELFKDGTTLRKLVDYFQKQPSRMRRNYQELSYALAMKLSKYYQSPENINRDVE